LVTLPARSYANEFVWFNGSTWGTNHFAYNVLGNVLTNGNTGAGMYISTARSPTP